MRLRTLAPLAVLILVGGCVVTVRDDPPPRRVVYASAPPPAAPATVVVTEDDEVHYVVYREYFGCTEEEIYVLPHYRHYYYGCTDDDFYFCFFVARSRGIAFDVCWHSYWYDCGRSCDRLIVTYNVPRERFFVAVGPGVTYPPVYTNTYVWYNAGARGSVTFTNTECVALVHMKVGCEYQGHPPTTYFAKVQANNGNTGRVIVQSRESCGNGGRSVTGVAVQKTAPRPWTMPPQQKQAWHQQQQTHVMKTETTFKEAHKEQVQKYQQEHPQPQQSQRQNAQKSPPGGQRGAEEHPHSGQQGQQGQGRPSPGNEPGHKGQAEQGQRTPPGKGEAPPPKGQHEEKHVEGGKGKGEEDKGKKGDK